jgi:DnaJ-class molecular chaperone
LALKYHPDKCTDAGEMFLKVKMVHEVLTTRRPEYDHYLLALKESKIRY